MCGASPWGGRGGASVTGDKKLLNPPHRSEALLNHSVKQARLEQAVARAHRSVWAAQVMAAGLDNYELADDLGLVLVYLSDCGLYLLRGGKPPNVRDVARVPERLPFCTRA